MSPQLPRSFENVHHHDLACHTIEGTVLDVMRELLQWHQAKSWWCPFSKLRRSFGLIFGLQVGYNSTTKCEIMSGKLQLMIEHRLIDWFWWWGWSCGFYPNFSNFGWTQPFSKNSTDFIFQPIFIIFGFSWRYIPKVTRKIISGMFHEVSRPPSKKLQIAWREFPRTRYAPSCSLSNIDP